MRNASVVLLLVAAAATARAAEFTAEVVKSEGKDRVTVGTIHVKDGAYRMEFPNPRGPEMVSITDPAHDVVRVLVPRYRLYMEDALDSMLARMNDPFRAPAMLEEHYEATAGGTESVAGYECEKQTFGADGQVAGTVWTSAKLGFPVKIVLSEEQGYFTELRKIEETPVADALLAVPEGYTKAEREAIAERISADPEMKAKREEWKRNRPRRASVGKWLSPGSEVKVLIGNATEVTVGLKYDAPDCKWSVDAFREGEAILPKRDEPLVGKTEVKMPEGKVPDLVVARGVEGKGYLNIGLLGKLPLVLATKTTSVQAAMGGPDFTLAPTCRKVTVVFTVAADAPGNMKAAFTHGDGQGHSENETFTLKPGETKTFEILPEDGTRDVGYSVMIGRATVEVTEDMRAPEDQKPF